MGSNAGVSFPNFYVVMFIMLYKVVLTFKSVDKTLECDHSNESYWAVLSGAVLLPYRLVLWIRWNPVIEIYSFLSSVGVAYNIHQKTLSDTVKREGLHAGAPGYKFIIFKSVFQTMTYPDLECFNKDGVSIELNIKLQYRARPNNLLEIIKQFKDSENYLDILK